MVDFKKIVEEQAAKEKQAEVEVAAVVRYRGEWWPRRVHELLEEIAGWIKPLLDGGTLVFEKRKIPLYEEALGSYEIESAKVRLGTKTLSIVPVGTFVIGAFGRVDVTGPNGKVTWLLLGERMESAVWHVVHPVSVPSALRSPSARSTRGTFVPLTKDLFEQLFVDLFGISG